jgi:heme-degrading monooxygenase HmoA
MFARLSVYEIPQESHEEADARFREALAQIGESEGFVEAYFLRGSESDRAAALTIWESYEAMTASRVAASRIRSDAAKAAGGDVLSAEEFVVVEHTRSAAAER